MGKSCTKSVVARMNKRVTVQEKTRATDSQGGWTDTWTDSTTVWASIEPKKAYERFQGGQLQTPATHLVKMRYKAGITAKSRLKYGTRVFEVKEVRNLEENDEFLDILVVEMQQ